jgi:hypothetical protein
MKGSEFPSMQVRLNLSIFCVFVLPTLFPSMVNYAHKMCTSNFVIFFSH